MVTVDEYKAELFYKDESGRKGGGGGSLFFFFFWSRFWVRIVFRRPRFSFASGAVTETASPSMHRFRKLPDSKPKTAESSFETHCIIKAISKISVAKGEACPLGYRNVFGSGWVLDMLMFSNEICFPYCRGSSGSNCRRRGCNHNAVSGLAPDSLMLGYS